MISDQPVQAAEKGGASSFVLGLHITCGQCQIAVTDTSYILDFLGLCVPSKVSIVKGA